MRSEVELKPQTHGSLTADLEWDLMQQSTIRTGNELGANDHALNDMVRTQEELFALQIQHRSLQMLVSELLVKNQQLRLQLSQHREPAVIATATPPPPRQDH